MTEIKAKAGDYVKIRLAQFKEVEGTILESYDKNVLLLKLNSGYNIGIPRENVHDFKVLKKFNEKIDARKIEKKQIGRKDSRSGKTEKPKIGLIITGGTIASKVDPRTGGVNALSSLDDLKRFYPNIFDVCDVRVECPFMIDSSDINLGYWRELARVCEMMLNDRNIQGIIIAHGTDSLHFSSAVLSFFLRNLNKPVVFTYSQRSIDRASSDAELNLECAVRMAISDCAEVLVVGHRSISDDFCYAHRGTKVRKLHSSRRDAFKSVNSKEVAKVTPEKVEFISGRRPRNDERVEVDDSFNGKVVLHKHFPGEDAKILDYYRLSGIKGIIIEGFGMGHVSRAWIPELKKLIKTGIFVGMCTQTIYGRVDGKVYSAGRELEDTGVIFLEDMLAETAFVKLSWVLGHREWRTPEKMKSKMLENIAGEFNELLGV